MNYDPHRGTVQSERIIDFGSNQPILAPTRVGYLIVPKVMITISCI